MFRFDFFRNEVKYNERGLRILTCGFDYKIMQQADYSDVDALTLNEHGGAILHFSGRPPISDGLVAVARNAVSIVLEKSILLAEVIAR